MKVRINDTTGAIGAWGDEVADIDGYTLGSFAPGTVPDDFDRAAGLGKYEVTVLAGVATATAVIDWEPPEPPDLLPHERATVAQVLDLQEQLAASESARVADKQQYDAQITALSDATGDLANDVLMLVLGGM